MQLAGADLPDRAIRRERARSRSRDDVSVAVNTFPLINERRERSHALESNNNTLLQNTRFH